MFIIGVALAVVGFGFFLGALWLYLHIQFKPDQRALIRHIVRLAQSTRGCDALVGSIIELIRRYEQEYGIKILITDNKTVEHDD
ncbi:MAG: hypothetical protein ACREHC_04620 [Candidatus Levyibacteriota bacterium]